MGGAIASVVIPAHNEGSVIARCLRALLADARPDEFEIVVVVNGSTDATARVAREVAPGVIVDEIVAASKIEALRRGDELATAFPRVYVDADIELDTAGVRSLAEVLSTTEPRAASPTMLVDVTRSTTWTRAYFRVWELTDYRRKAMIGSGVYGVSEAGHARIGDWPPLIADDLFVQESFAPAERRVVDSVFVVRAPRTLRDQVNRMIRWRQGNSQFQQFRRTNLTRFADAKAGGTSVKNLLRRVARKPARWADFIVYLGAFVVAGWAARRDSRSVENGWRRDATSRRP
ncbi:glycosyltransferase [Microbacterium schleiferi]|uniref:glycosyltransferase n=1 Tax=Microbacterium schleiferi TaxID=69362 RepID=UPI0035C7EF7A